MRKIKFRNILKSIYQEPESWTHTKEHPEAFIRDDHTLFFVDLGFKGYCCLQQGESELTFWQKVRFHRAFTKWKKCKL